MNVSALARLVLGISMLTGASLAFAAPPAAPVVTVGASNIKQLQFDWPAVPEAGRYELWFRAAPGAPWVKYTETVAQRPRIRINVSVHLLDWRVARYRVAACNRSGCTNSAEVGVDDLALDAVGYLKQYYAGEGVWFGQAVAMSADGMTAAVAMAQAGDSNARNGIVYLYRKTSATAAWRLETRLVPSLFRASSSQPYSSGSLAVNGDGTLVAFGRHWEGIAGQRANGAVYLFRRNGTTWRQEKRLISGIAGDQFGRGVDLDDSGNTLAVWRRAARTDVNDGYGDTEIYQRTSAGWQRVATVPHPVPPSGGYARCEGQALSGDGQTLVRTCAIPSHPFVLVHRAPGWAESARIQAGDTAEIDVNHDGTLFVARRGPAAADVYRLQQNVWSPDSGSPLDFQTNSTITSPLFTSIAMSRDGKFIAAGDGEDDRGTVGPNYPPIPQEGIDSRGSVYVFERKPSGWTLRRLMKPSVVSSSTFGATVGIGANGRNLIVGAVDDRSAATGINGDPGNFSPTATGAAWLY
jgi:hypothetical protein